MAEQNNLEVQFEQIGMEEEKIRKQLRMLFSAKKGTMPLNREFGIDSTAIGYPLPVAENLLALELIERAEQYIPDILVKEVTFENDKEGQLTPVIHITKKDQEWRDEE